MSWKSQKVLVTGAGGFIGSHLVERLVTLGSEVKAFVRYNSRNHWGLLEALPLYIRKEVQVISGNVKDLESIREATKGVDIIFHLAALISIPYSYINPRDFIETNVIGTLNVLNAARENEVGKVVHTSSSEVYGTAQYIPIDERHPLQAQSPYAASKIAADKLVESYYLSFGLPLTTVRPFNTYGPRQSARAIIPTIIMQTFTKEKVFLGSMHTIRDFNYVEDIVEAFIKAAQSPKSIGEVINFGSGKGISIEELSDKIISLIGKEVEIVFDATRIRPASSEVERLVADATKARQLLGWEPKFSLEDGIMKTIEWISEHINAYKVDIYNI